MKSVRIFTATLLALVGAAAAALAGNPVTLLNGTLSTNPAVIVYVGPQSGTTGMQTNVAGVVLASNTNTYSLATGIGTQDANTNWPSAGWSPQGNYPNTLYGPYNNMTMYLNYKLLGSSVGTVTFRFAASPDGTYWVSNYLAIQATNGTGGLAYAMLTPGLTNITTYGVPYYALQTIENTNAIAVSNIVIEVTGKPGL